MPAVTISGSQVYALAAGLQPSPQVRLSQAWLSGIVTVQNQIQVSQINVLVLGRGAVGDPSVRAWSFTLDGHDYYVVRLGNDRTLVFDNATKQWYNWGSGNSNLWKAFCGINWQAGDRLAGSYGSNVVVGDDANGSLYFLDPDGDKDDHPITGLSAQPFLREAYAYQTLHGYYARRCFAAYVLGSNGYLNSTTDTSVTLSYSDDRGVTFKQMPPVIVLTEDTQCVWRSLGSMQYPGRVFKVSDYGAFKRLDSIETMDDVK